jgi:hypothetical protein
MHVFICILMYIPSKGPAVAQLVCIVCLKERTELLFECYIREGLTRLYNKLRYGTNITAGKHM